MNLWGCAMVTILWAFMRFVDWKPVFVSHRLVIFLAAKLRLFRTWNIESNRARNLDLRRCCSAMCPSYSGWLSIADQLYAARVPVANVGSVVNGYETFDWSLLAKLLSIITEGRRPPKNIANNERSSETVVVRGWSEAWRSVGVITRARKECFKWVKFGRR